MSENDIAIFSTRLYEFELNVIDNGNTLVVEVFADVDREDEAGQLELNKAEARTLGQLLLRFADRGTTKP